MRFSYRIVREHGGIAAECLEVDAVGEGATETAALAALKSSLEERMFRPDAVAPPPEEPPCSIELVAAERTAGQPRPSLDLGGPGDAPTRG